MSEDGWDLENQDAMNAMEEAEAANDADVFTKNSYMASSLFHQTPMKRRSETFQSSPPSFQSPLFSNVQPTPIPSDLNIMSLKKQRVAESDPFSLITSPLKSKLSTEINGFGFSDSEDDAQDDAPLKKNNIVYTDISTQANPKEEFGFMDSDDEDQPKLLKKMSLDYDFKSLKKRDEYVGGTDGRSMLNIRNTNTGKNDTRIGALDGWEMHEFDEFSDLDNGPEKAKILRDPIQRRYTSEVQLIAPTKNYRSLPLTNNFIRGTSTNGVHLYFPAKRISTLKVPTPQNLLSSKISILMAQVQDDIKYSKTLLQMQPVDAPEQNESQEKQLWVDKYKPRQYVDLVGDEQVNRSVLNWIKEWDYCVFKKKKRINEERKNKFEKPQFEPDKHQRPMPRLILLSGPPGLGKTTLAHIVAKHAGYNVVEINASDERTGNAFKNTVLNAISSKSVMGNKKPNCVIIDEIDGVSGSGGDQTFIKMLVRLATNKKVKGYYY
jgi:hypothetical protein